MSNIININRSTFTDEDYKKYTEDISIGCVGVISPDRVLEKAMGSLKAVVVIGLPKNKEDGLYVAGSSVQPHKAKYIATQGVKLLDKVISEEMEFEVWYEDE